MKKHNIIFLFFLALAFSLFTCKDPVFYAISQEVKPIDPMIKGAPSNFAIFNNCMYVSSGNTLFKYCKNEDGNAVWLREERPGGNIVQIASTGDYLFALCATDKNNDGKTVLKRFNKDSLTWSELDGILGKYSKLHDIFAADNVLFIFATSTSTTSTNIFYDVIYIEKDKTESELLIENTGELTGAAFNGTHYFLSTYGRGVYKIEKDNINGGAVLIESNENFTGIINLQDSANTILLITRGGYVFTVDGSIVRVENISMGIMANGALGVWRDSSGNKLLLAGRQDSLSYSSSYGYKYGYMELRLPPSGISGDYNFIEPGIEAPSTINIGENERFQSTLGKYPINHIFQVPPEIDCNTIVFASTQKNGVWSYRDRGGVPQWNAE